MSKSDNLAELLEALAESAEKQVDPKTEDDTKKSAIVEAKDTRKDDPIGKAKEEVGLALWEGIRKIVPFVVLLIWIVASVALIIVAVSLLVVWAFYIKHLLADMEGIKFFLRGVYTFLGGVASTSLLFFLNRKPRQ